MINLGKISGLVYHKNFKILLFLLSLFFATKGYVVSKYMVEKSQKIESQISTLSMLDIGQGDSFTVELWSNNDILIDTGDDFEKFRLSAKSLATTREKDETIISSALKKFQTELLSAMSPKKFDIIFLSHDDSDHAGIIENILQTYRVGAIVVSPFMHTYIRKLKPIEGRNNFEQFIKVKNQKVSVLSVGAENTEIKFSKSKDSDISAIAANIKFIHPIPEMGHSKKQKTKRSGNEDSEVFVLNMNPDTADSTKVLFTGDAGIDEEKKFVSNLGQVDILKVGHHGSKTSTSVLLLETIRPMYALISAGKNNSYGHPHKIVMSRLRQYIPEANILETNMCGVVVFEIYKNGAVSHRFCSVDYDK